MAIEGKIQTTLKIKCGWNTKEKDARIYRNAML